MEAGAALGDQLTAAVASVPHRACASGSAITVVSTPARRGEWARHTRRQYPIAPWSVGAPSESGPLPHPGRRRLRLVSQLKPTASAGRVTSRMDGRANRLCRDDSEGRTRLSWEPVTCPLPARTGVGPPRRADGPSFPATVTALPCAGTARTDDLHRVTEAGVASSPAPARDRSSRTGPSAGTVNGPGHCHGDS